MKKNTNTDNMRKKRASKKRFSEEEILTQKARCRELKDYTGLTYDQLAEKLGYENFQQIYAFVSGRRQVSDLFADQVYKEFGWRREYMRGEDHYRTNKDLILAMRDFDYIKGLNALFNTYATEQGLELEYSDTDDGLRVIFTDSNGIQFTGLFEDLKDRINEAISSGLKAIS